MSLLAVYFLNMHWTASLPKIVRVKLDRDTTLHVTRTTVSPQLKQYSNSQCMYNISEILHCEWTNYLAMHLGDLTMRSRLHPARAPSHGWACKSLHSHVLSHLLHQKLQCKEGMKMETVQDSPLQPASPGLAMNWAYPPPLDKKIQKYNLPY